MGGYFKLYRELFKKPIWLNSSNEQRVILITLLAMANWKETEWDYFGEKIILKPGQFVTSLQKIVEQCKAEGETAKVSVRNARRDGIDALKKAVKDGLAEDEQKNAEAKLQKVHDKYIKQIDDMLAEKDKEIMTV